MAQKGRLYPVSQMHRLYSGDAVWPKFPSVRYNLSQSYIGGGIPPRVFTSTNAEVSEADSSPEVIVWRGHHGTWNGHDIDLGWCMDIAWLSGLWTCYGQLWVDGVPQQSPVDGGEQLLACQQMAVTVFSDSNPFVLDPGFGSQGATAVGW